MKYIEIETSQNVVIQFKLASLSDRIFAFFIDFGIALVTFTAFIVILNGLFNPYPGFSPTPVLTVLSFIPLITYHLIFEAFIFGRSPGKIIMRIMPVKRSADQISFKDYLIRWIFRLPDILLTSGSLAATMVYVSDSAQRIGEIASNTVTVKLDGMSSYDLNRILKMNQSQKEYLPVFPPARQLSDQDIFTIREVIRRHEFDENSPATQKALNTLVSNIEERLDVSCTGNKIQFLKTIIKDYVYLKR